MLQKNLSVYDSSPTVRHPPFSLNLCLQSGQTFAWYQVQDHWLGTIRNTAYVIQQTDDHLKFISSGETRSDSKTLEHYLALDEDPHQVIAHFPQDPFLQSSLKFCAGLRVLRQNPWECLAGFILSSTKQIIHIQQIWKKMSERWGKPVNLGQGRPCLHTFPEAKRLAHLSEDNLRSCGMGFRAPYLLSAARKVESGRLNLESLRRMPTEEARACLMELKGVGRKIADCVLLFSLGKTEAFPVDTWILKVLRHVYFRGKRRMTTSRLLQFATSHFGVYGGHAQQYLFHYARMNPEKILRTSKKMLPDFH